MKRITTAALAATTVLSLAVVPAEAAEENVSSSKAYTQCVTDMNEWDEIKKEGENHPWYLVQDYVEGIDGVFDELGVRGSTNPETCLRLMTLPGGQYRASTIAFLVLVPLALAAAAGAGAAATGLLPGVELPEFPGLPR